MTKQVARHGGAPGPYTKYQKTPYQYDGVPLHNSKQGQSPTTENFAKFATKHGILWPQAKRLEL